MEKQKNIFEKNSVSVLADVLTRIKTGPGPSRPALAWVPAAYSSTGDSSNPQFTLIPLLQVHRVLFEYSSALVSFL